MDEATGAQIVAAAVPSTYSESLESFCLELFSKRAIGDADKNRCVLIGILYLLRRFFGGWCGGASR
ncbi:MAG: TPM domain-containing protein [Eubacteriales bacterium]|nr:TPM domain-containing protein [Eubacteriales bacterium]